ncbi:MAG TPA: hypothetical protein VGL92_04315 [Acidimicrobiia bacterium]
MSDEAAAHQTHAVETNSQVWNLLGTDGRSSADDQRMVHAAGAERSAAG